MLTIHIDIETYCDRDLTKCGVYRYAEDPSFEIILFSYSWDHGVNVFTVDCSQDTYPGESIPADVWDALDDPNVLKIAHNANFEIVCIDTAWKRLDPAQWYCTMVGAAYLGLPMGLDKIAQVLRLVHQKDKRGSLLITYFSKPCRPTKKNGRRLRNLPEHDRGRWIEYGEYNAMDVKVECEIYAYIIRFPKPPSQERHYWIQDQEIAWRGIFVDQELIRAAIEANAKAIEAIHKEMRDITGVANPNAPAQLKAWLEEQLGQKIPSIGKEYLADALKDSLLPPAVSRVLALRKQGSNTSISKYATMLDFVCADGRIRGLLQFYGAGRTGRFAGRGLQVQNLKKTLKEALLEFAREAVKLGISDLIFDDVPDAISRLVRTAIIAPEGKSLPVSDFASIEARVLAWLAGEAWVLEVFNTHGKLYEATAAKMFSIPIESVTKGSPYRAKGKIAALALGYQGATGALITMGALREGLTEDELPPIVQGWRKANPNIVRFWRNVENYAKQAIQAKTRVTLNLPNCRLVFSYDRGYLFIELPSGRRLAYYGAEVRDYKLSYWGMDQVRKIWVKIDTYGGSLVENITQAVARDCLCDAMYRMKDEVYILMHIHDEIVPEADETEAPAVLKAMEDVMRVSPLWAKGLPLEGDGYISKFYKKD